MALVATDLLTTCRLGGSALDGAFVTSVLATAPSHLDARDESNWTPTMWTVRNGATEALGVLCAAGADVNALDRFSTSALHLAARDGRADAAAGTAAESKGARRDRSRRTGV